jgi:ketosteroid isomerase-like protein
MESGHPDRSRDTARAMSQENVKRAREAYEALGTAVRRGDFDAFFREYVHPEVEWVPLESGPDAAVTSGKEPVKTRLVEMLQVVDEPRIEAEEIIDAGEKVVVAIRISGRGVASGIDMEEAHWFHVVTARDDKAARIEWYASRAEALEAAGLSE